MGAALVGGALASFPGAARAAKGGGGGKSACAKYCKTLFGGDTAAQAECTAQGTKGTGPCFSCTPGVGRGRTLFLQIAQAVSSTPRHASAGTQFPKSYVSVLSPENAVLVRGPLATRPEPATAVPSPTGLVRSAGMEALLRAPALSALITQAPRASTVTAT
jgi:hypothetical protein